MKPIAADDYVIVVKRGTETEEYFANGVNKMLRAGWLLYGEPDWRDGAWSQCMVKLRQSSGPSKTEQALERVERDLSEMRSTLAKPVSTASITTEEDFHIALKDAGIYDRLSLQILQGLSRIGEPELASMPPVVQHPTCIGCGHYNGCRRLVDVTGEGLEMGMSYCSRNTCIQQEEES